MLVPLPFVLFSVQGGFHPRSRVRAQAAFGAPFTVAPLIERSSWRHPGDNGKGSPLTKLG